MTRAEAIALYQSGLESTVAKLLELAVENEQLRQQFQELQAPVRPAEKGVDPARPSAMTPAYEKPSSKGQRRKTPGRKKGHVGVRRKKPDHIDQVKEHKLECCPDCRTSLRGKSRFAGFRVLVKTSLTNTTAPWCTFSKKLTRLLRDAIRLRSKADALEPQLFEKREARLTRRLQVLINSDHQDKDCRRLVKRLRRHQNELLTFLDHPEVEWYNNRVERQLRPAVVTRKNSGGNHSDRGAETQAVMMTIFFTLALRDHDEVNTVIQMVEAYLKIGKTPEVKDKIPSNG